MYTSHSPPLNYQQQSEQLQDPAGAIHGNNIIIFGLLQSHKRHVHRMSCKEKHGAVIQNAIPHQDPKPHLRHGSWRGLFAGFCLGNTYPATYSMRYSPQTPGRRQCTVSKRCLNPRAAADGAGDRCHETMRTSMKYPPRGSELLNNVAFLCGRSIGSVGQLSFDLDQRCFLPFDSGDIHWSKIITFHPSKALIKPQKEQLIQDDRQDDHQA
jgi:hypothetical protein